MQLHQEPCYTWAKSEALTVLGQNVKFPLCFSTMCKYRWLNPRSRKQVEFSYLKKKSQISPTPGTATLYLELDLGSKFGFRSETIFRCLDFVFCHANAEETQIKHFDT